MLILQYKVIDMVVAFVLFIFMLVHCRVYCTSTVFGEQRFIYNRPFRRRTCRELGREVRVNFSRCDVNAGRECAVWWCVAAEGRGEWLRRAGRSLHVPAATCRSTSDDRGR